MVVVATGRDIRGEPRTLRKERSSGYPAYGEYVDPSRYWGERLGLPALYETYERVLGNRHAQIQSTVLSRKKPGEHADVVLTLFRGLIREYPELPTELATTESAMRHVVFGCVSKFSADDIRFYLTKPPTGRDGAWRARKLEVERLAGNWHFEWRPSFTTLNMIEAHILAQNSTRPPDIGEGYAPRLLLSDSSRCAGHRAVQSFCVDMEGPYAHEEAP